MHFPKLHTKKPITLVFVFIFMFAIFIPLISFANANGPALLQEYYNTGDDDYKGIYGATWTAQTFTTSASHTITSVKLKMYKYGSPGTLNASIKAVDGYGLPTGGILTNGTTDADTFTTDTAGVWYEIPVTSYTLSASTKYAIVCYISGSYPNYVNWRADSTSPTYSGGNLVISVNSGTSWTAYTATDMMFEVWGGGTYWLTGWSYRKQLNVSSVSGAGSNYQVHVKLHYGSGTDSSTDIYLNSLCKTDFSDIRFTDSTGNQTIWSCNETITASNNAMFWFNDTDNLSTGSSVVYLYYGNAGASSVSDPTKVFTFWDDFAGSALDYTHWGGDVVNASVANSICTLTAAPGYDKVIYENQTSYQYYALRSRVAFSSYALSDANHAQSIMFRTAGAWTNVEYLGAFYETGWIWQSWKGGSGANGYSGTADTSYHIADIGWVSNDVKFAVDNTVFYEYTNTNYISVTAIYPSIRSYCNSGANTNTNVDWIAVRKYVNPEPTITIGTVTFSNIGASTQVPAASCIFTNLATSNVNNVSSYIFTTNITGTLANDSATVFTNFYSSTAAWANVTKTLPATAGTVVQYGWFAEDTLGEWFYTGLYSLTTYLISTVSSNSHCTAWGYLTKSFYYNTRHWMFYCSGQTANNLMYSSSVDTASWTDPVNILPDGTSLINGEGFEFSIWFDSSTHYLHVAASTNTTTHEILYRRGTPNSDGSITWSAAWQVAISDSVTVANPYFFPCISVDTSGYAWIGYQQFSGANPIPYVMRNSATDGTWTTGYTSSALHSGTGAWFNVMVVPLTAGKVYVLYSLWGYPGVLYGRLYSGTMGSEETLTSDVLAIHWDALANGDDVYVQYGSTSTEDVYFGKRTYGGSWGSFSVIWDSNATYRYWSNPQLVLNGTAIYSIAMDDRSAINVFYKSMTISTGTWSGISSWFTDPAFSTSGMSAFYSNTGGVLGLLYSTIGATEYLVKYKTMTFEVAPPPGGLLPALPTPDNHDSLASTSLDFKATAWDPLTKTFYANNRHWIFYCSGNNTNNLMYSTSLDGVIWTTAANILPSGAGIAIHEGFEFDIWYDSSTGYLNVVCDDDQLNHGIIFRRGTPNFDGSFTWQADWQLIVSMTSNSATYKIFFPTVSTDSNGYAWVGYGYLDAGTGTPHAYVSKNSKLDGTWVADFTLSNMETYTPQGAWYFVQAVPLTSGKMYIVYARNGWPGELYGRLYSGTLGAQETIFTDLLGNHYTAVAVGDDVHIQYSGAGDSDVYYRKRTYGVGWSTPVKSWDSDATYRYWSHPRLVLNGTTELFSVVMDDINSKQFFFRYMRLNDSTWSDITTWFSVPGTINTYGFTTSYKSFGGNIGLLYSSYNATMSYYEVRYNYFSTYVVTYPYVYMTVLDSSPSGFGTTSPTTGEHAVAYGGSFTITAYPTGTNALAHWNLNGYPYSTVNPLTITMYANRTIQAIFSATPVVTITYPQNTTYATSTVPVQLSAIGGTIDKIWYNVKSGASWIYGSNMTYTSPASMTGLADGSYHFYAWANNTDGSSASAEVWFTVLVTVTPPIILYDIILQGRGISPSVSLPVNVDYFGTVVTCDTVVSANASQFVSLTDVNASITNGYGVWVFSYWYYSSSSQSITETSQQIMISDISDNWTATAYYVLTAAPSTPSIPPANLPTLVSTVSDSSAALYGYQRKMFYAAGRHWIFFSSNTTAPPDAYLQYLYYTSSTDGVNWASPVSLGTLGSWFDAYGSIGFEGSGYSFAIWFDGVYVHVVKRNTDWTGYSDAAGQISYRRGLPASGGSITWSSSWQLVVPHGGINSYSAYLPTICTDKDGFPFIAVIYRWYSGIPVSSFTIMVYKDSVNDGTWSTASGFPQSMGPINSQAAFSYCVGLSPSTSSDKVLVLWATAGQRIMGKMWLGGAWSSDMFLSSSNIWSRSSFSVIGLDDEWHVVYQKLDAAGSLIDARYYSNGWGETTVVGSFDTSGVPRSPVLARDANSTNAISLFWIDRNATADYIKFKSWTLTNGWLSTAIFTYDSNATIFSTLNCMENYYPTNGFGLWFVESLNPQKLVYASYNPPPPPPPTIQVMLFSIDNMDDYNWLYATRRYYEFHITIVSPLTICTALVNFTDGAGNQIVFGYNFSTSTIVTVNLKNNNTEDVASIELVGATAATYASNSSVILRCMLLKPSIDVLNIDFYGRVNLTYANGTTYTVGWGVIAEDYANLYSKGMIVDKSSSFSVGNSTSVTGGGILDLYAYRSSSSQISLITAKMQYLKLVPTLTYVNHIWSADDYVYYLAHKDVHNNYPSNPVLIYVIDTRDGSNWLTQLVVKIKVISSIKRGELYMLVLDVTWSAHKSGGGFDVIKTDRIAICPTLTDTENKMELSSANFWLDFWFDSQNSSSIIAGRINGYYYSMSNTASLIWQALLGAAWKVDPTFPEVSMLYAPLKNANGTALYTNQFTLVRVSELIGQASDPSYNHIFKISDFKTFETVPSDLSYSPSEFTGVAPKLNPTQTQSMPSNVWLGWLGNMLVGFFRGIANVISPALSYIGSAILGGLDLLLAWTGNYHVFTDIWNFIVSGLSWLPASILAIPTYLGYFFNFLAQIPTWLGFIWGPFWGGVSFIGNAFFNIGGWLVAIFGIVGAALVGTSYTSTFGQTYDFTYLYALSFGPFHAFTAIFAITTILYFFMAFLLCFTKMSLDPLIYPIKLAWNLLQGIIIILRTLWDVIHRVYLLISSLTTNLINAARAAWPF